MHRILVLLISCLLFPILAAGQAPMRIAIRAEQHRGRNSHHVDR